MRRSLLTLLLAVYLSGCGANVRTDGPTGGVRIEMLHEGEGNLAEYYRVDREGTLHFGGGREALLRKVTWAGPMSADQISGLAALLEEESLFTKKPTSSGTPRDVRTELAVVGPPGRQTIRVRGTCDAIDRVRAYLGEIATQRFDSFMRTLPQPTTDTDDDSDEPDDS